MSQVPEAWVSYRDWAGGLQATLSDDQATPQLGEREVDEMLARSDALAVSIRAHLDADEPEERELAALQLQAAAAVDIDRANALAAADDGLAPSALLADDSWNLVDRILSTPTEEGISALLAAGSGGFEFFATAAEALTLKDTVYDAVNKIAGDAERAAEATAGGLFGMATDELVRGLTTGVDAAFEAVSHKVNWLKRKAVTLVLKAVQKLLAVFGTRTDGLRAEVEKWTDDLEKGVVKALLERLYRIDELKLRFGSRIDGAGGGISADRERTARDELATLQAKWHLRAEVIYTIGKIVPYAKVWIIALSPPFGAVAYGAGFGLATGYVVFAGGDYLDWREGGGLLDMVEGVGAIVARAVGSSGAPAPPPA